MDSRRSSTPRLVSSEVETRLFSHYQSHPTQGVFMTMLFVVWLMIEAQRITVLSSMRQS